MTSRIAEAPAGFDPDWSAVLANHGIVGQKNRFLSQMIISYIVETDRKARIDELEKECKRLGGTPLYIRTRLSEIKEGDV